MTMTMKTMKYDREVFITILIAHQRMEDCMCLCGWGRIGLSFAEHLVNMYENEIYLLEVFKD